MLEDDAAVFSDLLEELNNVHHPSGPLYKQTQQMQALLKKDSKPLETVYHLVESHAPGLRQKIVLRSLKNRHSDANGFNGTMDKNLVDFQCSAMNTAEKAHGLVRQIMEMPAEWTLIQLTPGFNPDTNLNVDPDRFYTSSLFVSVFSCGKAAVEPFSVHIDAPKDSTGASVELVQEIHAAIKFNKERLMNFNKRLNFKDKKEQRSYSTLRSDADSRMKNIVKDLQNLYLREWKCLLTGKFVDGDVETKITSNVKNFLDQNKDISNFLSINSGLEIFKCMIKNYNHLKTEDLKQLTRYLFQGDLNLQKSANSFAKSLHEKLSLSSLKRYPIILVVDDSLDCFPWEMMDVLVGHPVSRLPSFYLAYALFKEHESTIQKGFKIIKNPENGTFIINPDMDLEKMQNRMSAYVQYWLPKWQGICGVKPESDEFKKLLVDGEVFLYAGHGSGSQFCSMQTVENLRVPAVVLLFGCSSTQLRHVGPQTEPYSAYQMYLTACSPCIVGMLWTVTDLDTDYLTTEFLSLWIENKEKPHWRSLNKDVWRMGDTIDLSSEKVTNSPATNADCQQQAELLRALSLAKTLNVSRYVTRASCVARGIPVKFDAKKKR